MGLLGLLLEWLFPTREEQPHEDYHIDLYQKDGVDMLSLLRWERGQRNYAFWLEVMERLMAGRLCVTQVEQWSCIEKREERRRTAKNGNHLLRDVSDALWAGAFA